MRGRTDCHKKFISLEYARKNSIYPCNATDVEQPYRKIGNYRQQK
jgi:hypothetical protein